MATRLPPAPLKKKKPGLRAGASFVQGRKISTSSREPNLTMRTTRSVTRASERANGRICSRRRLSAAISGRKERRLAPLEQRTGLLRRHRRPTARPTDARCGPCSSCKVSITVVAGSGAKSLSADRIRSRSLMQKSLQSANALAQVDAGFVLPRSQPSLHDAGPSPSEQVRQVRRIRKAESPRSVSNPARHDDAGRWSSAVLVDIEAPGDKLFLDNPTENGRTPSTSREGRFSPAFANSGVQGRPDNPSTDISGTARFRLDGWFNILRI